LHKKRCQGHVGVLKKLYSGSFQRFIAQFLSILQRSPNVKFPVTYKTYRKPQL
jgi:hypothetical protein